MYHIYTMYIIYHTYIHTLYIYIQCVCIYINIHTYMHIYIYSAAAAKSLQLCPTQCSPIDSSPPGFSVPGFSWQEYWSGLPFPTPVHKSDKRK